MSSRAMLWLGQTSYSLYMIHYPLLAASQRVWDEVGSHVGRAIVVAITVPLIIGLARVMYAVVELPAQRVLLRASSRLIPPTLERSAEEIQASRIAVGGSR